MDGGNKEEGASKGLKVTLGVLAVVALALGVGILVVGLNFGNNDNSVKDENLITEYETVNEDGEEVIVRTEIHRSDGIKESTSSRGDELTSSEDGENVNGDLGEDIVEDEED